MSVGHSGLPTIPNYKLFSDISVDTRICGGIIVYIKNNIANHVFQIKYNTCYISFRLDFCPELIFIGTYIQPESSKYFSPNMFADVASLLIDCKEKLLTPMIGGDFNSRPGDINQFSDMNYTSNMDKTSNNHGTTYFPDICKTGDIFPLNHLKYKNKQYIGNFTYHKTGKNSQIDFVLTNKNGMYYIRDFQIINTNWHLSDHRPVYLKLDVRQAICTTSLLNRAKELNYEYDPNEFVIKRYTKQYNFRNMQDYFEQNSLKIENDIVDKIDSCDIESAIETLNMHISDAHKQSKISSKSIKSTLVSPKNAELMNNANSAYEIYQYALANDISTQSEINTALNNYTTCRKALTYDILSHEKSRWKQVMLPLNAKEMWNKIDWKGSMHNKPIKHPMIDELQLHYESLYSKDDPEESLKITNLSTNVYIPVLDDPITGEELHEASQSMKKGGYDVQLPVIKILVTTFAQLILLIMNFMFFLQYPINLACSLLISLPKKGNLSLPKNWRGIQMLPGIAALYDRILAKRLYKWIGVDDEQTAFQKGKSTLHQLFTLRLLIALAHKLDITLYIGLFDIEKAFDKISRLLLLKKLVTLGIGSCMLNALKLLYIPTFCILNFYGQSTSRFETCSGIRQGAASSVFLFIVFINDLICYLKNKCIEEPLIGTMHSLLHADDTAILSTDRDLFIKKCNHMLDYFERNKLGLNLGKSGYMIINGKAKDIKCTLTLQNGSLHYKQQMTYLGAIFSDAYNINKDISLYIAEKRPNITVKFYNFCAKNYLAPLNIKLMVLNSCANSSLTYGSETWGKFNTKSIETLVRLGIKSALSIRKNTPNEIVYIESGMFPIECGIRKQQLKFWLNMEEQLQNRPNAPLSRLISQALAIKLPYIMYYKNLKDVYHTPSNLLDKLKSHFEKIWLSHINTAADKDPDSKLGTYKSVNPTLQTPSINATFETERIMLTRYRTGNHNLLIERGRYKYPKIPREDRLCSCDTDIQTLEHCLCKCPKLDEARMDIISNSLAEYLQHENIYTFLLKMEKELNIKNYI